MSKLIFAPEAEADLQSISDYLADFIGEAAAEATVDAIAEKCRSIAVFPLAGRNRYDLGPNLRSFVVYPYVLFYLPLDGGIMVLRVLHTARDIEGLFEQ